MMINDDQDKDVDDDVDDDGDDHDEPFSSFQRTG